MLGRDRELEALDSALDAVARGGVRLVLVRGEAGIGKTLLLATLRRRAEAMRFVVLAGHATELERDVPFVPIFDALGPAPVSALATERWRVHRALAARLADIAAGRPLLLVIDDVHWADPATLEFLEHLVRRPPAGSMCLALGLRPGAEADRLVSASRAVEPLTLDLAPLARAAAEPLLAGVQDPDRVFHASGGNPLLLNELARDGGRELLPGGIVAAVRVEVAALPTAAQRLAQAAAVVGDPFELDLAARIAGLDDEESFAALDALERTGLVRAGTVRGFAFRHPIVRSAVYAGLGSGARLARHAAAARELARTGAALPLRAHHLVHAAVAGDLDAAEALRSAAAEVRPQAPGVAADWLLAARRVDAVGADLAALAETLIEAGRFEPALSIADEARMDPRMAVVAASVERLLGRHDAARRRLLRALDSGQDTARVCADLAVAAYQQGDYGAMRGWAERATGGTSGAVGAIAATLLAVGDAFAGSPAVELGALIDAVDDDELGALAEPAMAIPWGLLALDRLPQGLAAARRIAAAARRAGNGVASIPHELAAVLALGLLGRIGEAEPAADAAEQSARMSGNAQLLQWALWLDAWVLMERGRLDAALVAAQESVELARDLEDSASAVVARAVLGAVLVARGSHAEGRPLLAAYDIDRGWVCRWAPVLVGSDLAVGDLAAARAHAERAAALAPASGMAGARAAAARAQALVALAEYPALTGTAAADGAARAATFARVAIAEAEVAGAALEGARAHVLAGRALIGDAREAGVAHLESAVEAARRCGAPRVVDEAQHALRRAGVRIGRGGPRAPGTTGLDALSPREREIADLVATGLTNREIGARLFLSEKTIETHLTRVFQKLGLRSRAQVAAAVSRRG